MSHNLKTKSHLYDQIVSLKSAPLFSSKIIETSDAVISLASPYLNAHRDKNNDYELATICLTSENEDNQSGLISTLGLDFTFVAYLKQKNILILSRGPLGRSKLYFRPDKKGIRLTPKLWAEPEWDEINHNFFFYSIANSLLTAPVECDYLLETAANHWLRVPRGSIMILDIAGTVLKTSYLNIPIDTDIKNNSTADLESQLRDQLDEHLTKIIGNTNFTTEISGGIDSGIITSRAKRLFPNKFLGGVSVISDFYELRREKSFIEDIAKQADIPLSFINAGEHLPFSDLHNVPIHDEPSLSSIPWQLVATSLKTARALGAETHIHGIGGDQVFIPIPEGIIELLTAKPKIDFLNESCRKIVKTQINLVKSRYFNGTKPVFVDRGLLLYDGWADHYIAPNLNVRYEAGWIDANIIRLCEELRNQAPYPNNIFKPLPRNVFASDLPESVRERPGKIGFDGIYQRGLRQNFDTVCSLIEDQNIGLEKFGVKPKNILREIKNCARLGWDGSSNTILFVISWAAWANYLYKNNLTLP